MSSQPNSSLFNLLIIDYNQSEKSNWYKLFSNHTTKKGQKIHVEQAGWEEIKLVANSEYGPMLELKGKNDSIFKQQRQDRTLIPHFVLVRNFPSALHTESYRNVLLGLMFANVPAMNSLDSIYMCSEKPIVYGKLKEIQKKLGGFDAFPLIPQIYYPNIRTCDWFEENEKTLPQEFPVVCKIGTIHAGFGKQKLDTKSQFDDFTTLMALYKDYFTCEPFCNVEYDLRLQKIGNHYRVYQRSSDSSWKNNWGAMKFKPHDTIEERYKIWMDEVSKMFGGGLDMFTLDVMKLKDGSERILELNDSSMGLLYDFEEEDNAHIVDLVMSKINQMCE
ncbi:hypothetical protein FDP41_002792 [Naegleria fowleri]|uniref:ATP-grasp domain-containing protein n=1 Tax=Naegleria fowleri TaxID=5763 RepID=A0A6A5BML5_NAEFO|nr:uncharacterized protein FDP41_002792 [Naegleria fowleri]KAF0978277.1 hypothetical protein FDP41_002792 [Naegleria fowleri]CAG4716044.1 unnamed protein product [Naegleria fowleri]